MLLLQDTGIDPLVQHSSIVSSGSIVARIWKLKDLLVEQALSTIEYQV